MAQPPIDQNGVKLRDPEDFDTLRADIFDGVKQEVISAFPKSYGGVRLEVADVDYEGDADWDFAAQRNALLHDDFLARKLRGTVRLFDEATGDLIEERRQSLMRVPWLTQRGTFIHKGNEYSTINQNRLVPGPYTRRTESGVLETHFNPRPGSGRGFRLSFDPESAQYRLGVQSSQLHLYSLLKDLGHSDDDLAERWGPDVLRANAEHYDSRVLPRAYKHFVPAWRQEVGVSREAMVDAVRDAISKVEVNRAVAERTLPNWFSRTKAASWAAKQAGAVAARVFFERAVEQSPFSPDMRPSELWRIRAHDHIDIRADRRLLSTKKASIAVDLDGTLAHKDPGPFDPNEIGDPVPAMLKRVKKWIEDGEEVIIFTARAASKENIPPVKAWLKEHGLGDLKVTCRKTPDIEEIYDDRAHNVERNTGKVKEASAIPNVELGERKETFWICPHCREEIHEKGSYLRDALDEFKSGAVERPMVHIHGACGGEFMPPPPTPEEQAWLERLKSARVLPPVALALEEDFEKEAASGFQKELDASDIPSDIVFYTDGNDRCTVNIGDWHTQEQADAADALARKWFGEFEEADDTEIGKPGWCIHTLQKSAKVTPEKLRAARAVTDEPKSHAQAEAGNYAKGTVWWNGLKIRLENSKGSVRKGLNPDGSIMWRSKMYADYGYIAGTRGVDGDEFDVFIGPHLDSEIVYIVDQIDQKTEEFDEHKAMLGCRTEEQAKELYLKNFSSGWKVGPIRSMTFPQFKIWLRQGKKLKPVAETPAVKMASAVEGFDPDLGEDDMQEAYDAVYGGSKPRLASMQQWPAEWMPPGSDSLGWINWYQQYLNGARTDDDARQIKRWKAFKARHGAQFKKNPTPRRAYALRYWAIDPLKLIDDETAREAFKVRMEDYRAKETERWLREKTASLTFPDLKLLANFLNTHHGAGIPLNGTQAQIEDAIAVFLGADDSEASAFMSAADTLEKTATEGKGCLMLKLPLADAVRTVEWAQEQIPEADLAGDGLERDSHVTVLYGFNPKVSYKAVAPLLPEEPIQFKLGRIRRFEANERRPESDVIVVEVESEDLQKLHAKIRDEMGEDVQLSYPDYTPHMTLAYVKPGSCKGLDGHAYFDGKIYLCDTLVFSSACRKRKMTLKIK